MSEQIFIAEVKTMSPYGWESEYSWDELFEIANEHGDWVSVHTDYRWGGSFDLITKARQKTDKKILAKGVHKTDEEISRAVELGANHVLVVGRMPGVYVEECLIEPVDAYQLFDFPDSAKLVWNDRNLTNGNRKLESFCDVRHLWPNWLAQASFIRSIEDVEQSADAYIVGQNLPDFVTTL